MVTSHGFFIVPLYHVCYHSLPNSTEWTIWRRVQGLDTVLRFWSKTRRNVQTNTYRVDNTQLTGQNTIPVRVGSPLFSTNRRNLPLAVDRMSGVTAIAPQAANARQGAS